MVRLNKTKPEDYMRPLDVPGGRKQNPHARKAQTPREPGRVPGNSNPGRSTTELSSSCLDVWINSTWWFRTSAEFDAFDSARLSPYFLRLGSNSAEPAWSFSTQAAVVWFKRCPVTARHRLFWPNHRSGLTRRSWRLNSCVGVRRRASATLGVGPSPAQREAPRGERANP